MDCPICGALLVFVRGAERCTCCSYLQDELGDDDGESAEILAVMDDEED